MTEERQHLPGRGRLPGTRSIPHTRNTCAGREPFLQTRALSAPAVLSAREVRATQTRPACAVARKQSCFRHAADSAKWPRSSAPPFLHCSSALWNFEQWAVPTRPTRDSEARASSHRGCMDSQAPCQSTPFVRQETVVTALSSLPGRSWEGLPKTSATVCSIWNLPQAQGSMLKCFPATGLTI